jgi:ElaA protein
VIGETSDIALCQALRRTVFILEQGVSEADEVDGRDGEATHLLATTEGRPVGTARILWHGDTAKIGRVCVLAEARGTGLGAALIRHAVAVARTRGACKARLGAQLHALGFYERLGFAAEGPVYDDAGLPHRDMTLDL